MYSLITILLFFVYTWGIGYTATYFLKKPENYLERFFLNVGIGLGVFAILSILLNFLHILLDWRIFLGMSLILPAYILIKSIIANKFKWPSINFKLTKSTLIMLVVLLIAVASLYIYAKGAFSYPYLEDEDPWGHSVGAKYVALEKNAYDPPLQNAQGKIDIALSYIDPYPPVYDVLMGILHQTSPDLAWTLKFFNALIISLSFIFFYIFAQQFIGSRNKALFATFVLAAIPCYLSHFIWAHALSITLFFPALYAFVVIKEDKKWTIIAALIVGGIWVSQNVEEPIKLTTMLLIYLIAGSIVYWRILKYECLALISGIIISFVWWGTMIVRYGFKNFVRYYTAETIFTAAEVSSSAIASAVKPSSSFLAKFNSFLYSLVLPRGTGARAYSFEDFFVAKGENMINNPIGIGMVLSILALLGVVYILWKYKSALIKKENAWLCITLFWLIFTFWGVNGLTFPGSVARGPFRTWMLLAIPVALISAEGLYFVKGFFTKNKIIQALIVVAVLIGIIYTSGIQKYEVNTANWPTSGSFMTSQEPFQYGAWFETLPINTNVFLYSPRDKLTIGFSAFSCDWCQEVMDFREDVLNKDVNELYSFLKKNEYKYFVVNPSMDFKYFKGQFGENKTRELLPQRYQEISNSDYFIPVYQTENSFTALKVK